MIKLLMSLFGWVPGVGESLKIAYISQRALEVVKGLKVDANQAQLNGAELQAHCQELATNAYDEFLRPEVDEFGLPEFASNAASKKAIEIMTEEIKKKYTQKVS